MKAQILVLLMWLGYGIIHSILAAGVVKRFFETHLPSIHRYYRVIYNVLALGLLILCMLVTRSLPSAHLFKPNTLSTIVGLMIALPGLALMLYTIRRYFFNLSGLKSFFQESQEPFLIISGVHRYVRHPLYLGTFLFIWGMAVIWPLVNFAMANLAITVYTITAIRFEESKLIASFGDIYSNYRKKVPMLLPLKGRAWTEN